MRVLLHKEPRVVALEGPTHCVTFHQHKGPTTSNIEDSPLPRVVVHLDTKSTVSQDNGFEILIKRNIFGCLGLICIGGSTYLAIVTGAVADVALPLPYESVNRIFAVEFISITEDEWDYVNLDSNGFPIYNNMDPEDTDTYSQSAARLPHPCWELRKLLLNGSFYYSNDFDLTSMLQNRGVNTSKLDESQNSEDDRINVNHYQEQFMWNNFMMEDMLRFKSSLDESSVRLLERNRFFTTVIRGFAKTIRVRGSNTISIISKQSWKRAGTRFHSRGIDDNGDVANFVESEFIFYNPSKRLVFAYTQIRGSVPAFWEQDLTLINPKITVTRSAVATQHSFDAHFTQICSKYNACHIVNLLSKTKLLEMELLRRYTELLSRSSHSEDLLYTHFDFHNETKSLSGGFAGAIKIIQFLRSSLEHFSWFDYALDSEEVLTRQEGVFRVNCLDCLDRTNLIEQVICQTLLEQIIINHYDNRSDRSMIDDLIGRHNDLWADNGDAISQIYTGTNALKSSFTRSGKMNLAGALSDVTKSVSRMYQNTFVDSKKQSTIDLLLGKDGRFSIPVKIYDPSSDYVSRKLREQESSFTTYDNVSLFAGTFNVNAATPNKATDLSKWLYPAGQGIEKYADIYALGLQELIELNAGSILAGDTTKPLLWAKAIQDCLNSRREQYLLLRTELMSSMCLFLFVKKSKISYVTQVAGLSKKTGLGGITANKGACAVRFEFGSTSFALVTSHLAAGVNATVERENDFMTIMLGLSFSRNLTLSDHDNIVWFGDLNYRLNIGNDRCRSLIDHGAFDELQALDQLSLAQRERNGAFSAFEESRILFLPTYKFDKGTSQYDSSEKQRVPSWTDRILYRSKNPNSLSSLEYDSVMEILISDHKPVYSNFSCGVKFIDQKLKQKLSSEYYKAFKSEHGEISDNDISSGIGSIRSRASQSSGFASDTLSELNFLDVEPTPPPPPPRARTMVSSRLPRKVPPPPMDCIPSTESSWLTSDVPSKNSSPLSFLELSTSSGKPKESSSVTLKPHLAHLGISSAPLTPKNGSSLQTSKSFTAGAVPPVSATEAFRPMKPLKPVTLSASKLEAPDQKKTSSTLNGTIASVSPKTTAPTVSQASRPVPPPSRTTQAKTNGGLLAMSDWKPLTPRQ